MTTIPDTATIASAPKTFTRSVSSQLAPRGAGVRCGYCGEPVGKSRYRTGDQRMCRPCGSLTRMSGKQRTDLLREHLTADLLHRVTLLPTEITRDSLQAALSRKPGVDTSARFAGIPTEVLTCAALRAWAHVPQVADEIGRRGAAFLLAEQAGWTDARWLPEDVKSTVRLALEQDDTLTAEQLTQITDSRFRAALVTRIGELDSVTAAKLVTELEGWAAYRLADLGTAPVELLTALAENGPYTAAAVVRDPRATAETLAAIAIHHQDRAWQIAISGTLGHRNVDVALLPVPLLAGSFESRSRMVGYLDARLGVGTSQRTTAARVGDGFAGTLADLLAIVATLHQSAAD
jgi:hypothetical protein